MYEVTYRTDRIETVTIDADAIEDGDSTVRFSKTVRRTAEVMNSLSVLGVYQPVNTTTTVLVINKCQFISARKLDN